MLHRSALSVDKTNPASRASKNTANAHRGSSQELNTEDSVDKAVNAEKEEKNYEAWFMHNDTDEEKEKTEREGRSCSRDGRGPVEVLRVLHRGALSVDETDLASIHIVDVYCGSSQELNIEGSVDKTRQSITDIHPLSSQELDIK